MLTKQDEEHLDLLSIFHYVMAGLTALLGLLPLLYVLIGALAVGASTIGGGGEGAGEARIVGGIFIALGLILTVVIFGIGFIHFMAGRFLSQRRNYSFCFVYAIVELLFFPLGTALGIFTIIVLSRPQVKAAMTSQGLLA